MTFTVRLDDDRYISIDISELTDEEIASLSPEDVVSIGEDEEPEPEPRSRRPGIGRVLVAGLAAIFAIALARHLLGGDGDGGADIEIDGEEEATA